MKVLPSMEKHFGAIKHQLGQTDERRKRWLQVQNCVLAALQGLAADAEPETGPRLVARAFFSGAQREVQLTWGFNPTGFALEVEGSVSAIVEKGAILRFVPDLSGQINVEYIVSPRPSPSCNKAA